MTHPRTSLLAALALAVGFTSAWAQSTGTAAPATSSAASQAPAPAAKPPGKAVATVPGSTTNNQATTPAAKAAPVAAPANPSVPPTSTSAALPSTTIVKPAASAPYKGKPSTRPLTGDEERESAVPPGELRPERVIIPQVSIPLGKKSGESTQSTSKPSGSVHDAAGRCAAIADENERAICRERAGLGTAVRK